MSSTRRILKYFFTFKKLLVYGIIYTVLSSLFTLAPAKLGGGLFKIILEDNIAEKKVELIILYTIIAVLVFTLLGLFEYLKYYYMTYLGKNVVTELRKSVYQNMVYLPMKFFKDRKSGDIYSRIINDTQLIEEFVMRDFQSLFKDPIVICGALIMMFINNVEFTLILLAIGPIIALLVNKIGTKIRRIVTKVQEKLGDVTSILHETIYGIEVIKTYVHEKEIINKFNTSLDNYLKEDRKSIIATALSRPAVDFVGALGASCIFITGIFLIINNSMTLDKLMEFAFLVLILSSPIQNITKFYTMLQRVISAADRTFDVMDEKREEHFEQTSEKYYYSQKDIDVFLNSKSGIIFDNVNFNYDRETEQILSNINLTIKHGETIAIVGNSGSGKTTLINLIPRLFVPTSGKIIINNVDISKIPLNLLRQDIGIISQESILFPGTIRENIIIGKYDATEDQVTEALELSKCDDFVNSFPDGYNTEIGERGIKLSGGQRQRLSIARAIIKKPDILILDEATSALDTESERHVQQALNNILGSQTTIIISHRYSTIKNADRIVVLYDGKITEIGTHEELIEKGKYYNKIYELQFEK